MMSTGDFGAAFQAFMRKMADQAPAEESVFRRGLQELILEGGRLAESLLGFSSGRPSKE